MNLIKMRLPPAGRGDGGETMGGGESCGTHTHKLTYATYTRSEFEACALQLPPHSPQPTHRQRCSTLTKIRGDIPYLNEWARPWTREQVWFNELMNQWVIWFKLVEPANQLKNPEKTQKNPAEKILNHQTSWFKNPTEPSNHALVGLNS